MKSLLIGIASMTLIASSFSAAYADNSRGERKLKKLLSPHIFVSRGIGADVREAAGDRRMAVFDNRKEKGSFAQCTFITVHGKRAIVCNDI